MTLRVRASLVTISMLVATLLVWPMETSPCADGGCANEPIPGGLPDTVNAFLSKDGHQCQEGDYVEANRGYTVDAYARAQGACDHYVPVPPDYLTCTYSSSEHRGLSGVNVTEDGVAGAHTSFYPLPSGSHPHEIDTKINGTTSPENGGWTFNIEGERTLRYTSTIFTTACNIQPGSFTTMFPVVVVKCLPVWQKDTGGDDTLRYPPETVEIRIDPNLNARMKQAMKNAIGRWNTALTPYPTKPTYTWTESNTSCEGVTNCTNVREGEAPPGSCARADLTSTTDGIVQRSTIYFPANSSSWYQNFADRTAAHEMGHHMGLGENDTSCATGNSVMRPVACNALFGYPTAPTPSDHTAVGKTVYDGYQERTCPAVQ